MKKLFLCIVLFAIIGINSKAAEPKCIFNVKCTGNETVCKKSLAGIQKFLIAQLNKSGWAKVDLENDYNYVIVITVDSLTKANPGYIDKMKFNVKLIRGETVLKPERTFTEYFDLVCNGKSKIKPASDSKITHIEKNMKRGDIEDRQFDVASVIFDRIEQWIKEISKS
jgi:hypothetical protein